MRRVTKIVAAGVASAALALTATACGSSSSSDTSKAKGVGIAYDVGGRGDHSFNDSAAKGLDKAKADFSLGTKELTAKNTDTEADREQKLNDLASAGYNPVIGVGFAYADSVKAVSKKYPKTTFTIVDSVVDGPNVDSVTFTEEQSSYLAGVAAALKTKTNKIGFIGGVDITLIKKFAGGFQQGVKDTKPSATVDIEYITHGGDLSGVAKPAEGKAKAKGMLDRNIDVIYAAAGSSGAGAIEAVAGKQGTWAIGVDGDQYLDKGLAQWKNSILTSVIKNVDGSVYDVIKSVKDGKPMVGSHTYDLKAGGVGLTTSGGFIDDIKTQLDAAKKKIADGTVTVQKTPTS
ncbi:BMP family ABC transporter substrate-binding protein [Streptomyces sp. PH10-H1]|uniref:BMP family lipoprotein n=1 Tax=Streptomyces sp. PH10-H1 TaxID=3046212 RepID=UPI0024BA9D22|nr:BMP family ABC transporter substrate-binding protein [Streptomyces sp. PH10-H1]MDJ0340501.1 BMP family ABC transporter substrate-binding protein [Streptomyces sp. PH10-H1]